MYQRVREYIQRYQMLGKEDKVITGVSGGADSICLLFMLIELSKELGFSIVAVHVHHGLRGKAADADEAYVQKVCLEQRIELKIFHEDVKAYAKKQRLTLEEAGRNIRRMRFEQVLEETGGTKIALAHHQNDNVETLIWNLCRGCGLNGMGGIAPKDGVYVRPLLCLKRKEIESYLIKRGISYCTDETNLEDDYTRNRIRSHVIPYLEDHVNRQAIEHMAEVTEQMRKLEEYVEHEVQKYTEKCICRLGDTQAVLKAEEFRRVPDVLQTYVIHGMLCQIAGRRKDIESTHIRLIRELMEKQVGRKIDLPYHIQAKRCYEGIWIYKDMPEEDTVCADGEEENVEKQVRMRIFERQPGSVIFPKKTYTKWFDYDIIKNTVKIRHRAPGDYITIDKNGGTQKIKQYFINEKIPRGERDRLWLVADGSQIMWIVGYRQSQKYQVTEQTRRILEIDFHGGEKDGREH